MNGSRLAWTIASLDIAAILGVSVASPVLGIDGAIVFSFGIISFAVVGALLKTRVPANPIGVLLLAAGTLLACAMAIGLYADIATLQVPAWRGSEVARGLQATLFVYPFFIALVGVPLVFPDGHLASPRFRWIAWLTIAGMIAWAATSILRSVLGVDAPETGSGPAIELLLGVLDALFFVAISLGFAAGLVAIGIRFRRGSSVERQQIKWLLTVVSVGAAILPVSFIATDQTDSEIGDLLANLTVLTLFALPIAIGVAVLRYRLYEIDRIISRTVGWALLTAAVVAAFIGAVLVLQTALAGFTQGQTLAVAASTLLAFALFQPLRRGIQRAVDRRFDRARYDAERTIDAFAERVRNEVDLPRISGSLLTAAGAAVRPVGAGVWLRQPGP